MAEFKSVDGTWYPANQAATDLLKEKGYKTLGKTAPKETIAKSETKKKKKKGKK